MFINKSAFDWTDFVNADYLKSIKVTQKVKYCKWTYKIIEVNKGLCENEACQTYRRSNSQMYICSHTNKYLWDLWNRRK